MRRRKVPSDAHTCREELTLRIPPYEAPRNAWRKKLHHVVLKRQRKSPVRYTEEDKLEVEIRLYIKGMGLTLHDVDNRLKDILDALQGTRWRTKEETRTRTNRFKRPADLPGYYGEGLPPRQRKGLGRLTIRKFRAWKFTR
jgi:hypothetical protein